MEVHSHTYVFLAQEFAPNFCQSPPLRRSLKLAPGRHQYDPTIFLSMSWSPGVVLVLIFLGAGALSVYATAQRQGRRPPGPRGLPFIGNILQIPKDKQWLVWDKWAKTYGGFHCFTGPSRVTDDDSFVPGDVVCFSILGSENIVLSSYEAATELLDSRG